MLHLELNPLRIVRTVLYLFITTVSPTYAASTSDEVRTEACLSIKSPSYKATAYDERPYLCALPEPVKKNVPDQYWWPPEQYQTWLKTFSLKTSAPVNLGKDTKESHQRANDYVKDSNGCHFYSSISPSVQRKEAYTAGPRTRVVLDERDLLEQCMSLGEELKKSQAPLCSVIEFAGHSTQSVGLDSIFGIDIRKAKKVYNPSKQSIRAIGACLRRISSKSAIIFFSTCGGDKEVAKDGTLGPSHYWPGKESAQRELADLLQMTVVSGIGFVDGTPDGGVICDDGWHISNY